METCKKGSQPGAQQKRCQLAVRASLHCPGSVKSHRSYLAQLLKLQACISQEPGVIPCPSPNKPLQALAPTNSPLLLIPCLFLPHYQIPTQTHPKAASTTSCSNNRSLIPRALKLEKPASGLARLRQRQPGLHRRQHQLLIHSQGRPTPSKYPPKCPPPRSLLYPSSPHFRSPAERGVGLLTTVLGGSPRELALFRLSLRIGAPLRLSPRPELTTVPEPQILRPRSNPRQTPGPAERLGLSSPPAPGGPDLAGAGGRPARCRPRSR